MRRHPDHRIPSWFLLEWSYCGGHQKVKGECAWISAISQHTWGDGNGSPENECAGTALPFKWPSASSNETWTDHSSPSNDAGVVLEEWVGGRNVGWQVEDKIQANQCEGGKLFAKLKKLQNWRLKGERLVGYRCWIRPPQGNFCWNGVWRKNWWNRVGVGGVKGGHQIKVRKALDLVTFLTGLLNSRWRVIIMQNQKDTLNSYQVLKMQKFSPTTCLIYVYLVHTQIIFYQRSNRWPTKATYLRNLSNTNDELTQTKWTK
jgi:hypothetical protein